MNRTVVKAGVCLILCLGIGALAIGLRKDPPHELLQQGVLALAERDLLTVRDIAAQLEAAQDGHDGAQLLNGWLAMEAGDFNRALALLTPGLARGPHRLKVLVSIAECQYRVGQLAAAGRLLSEIVDEFPDSAHAHRLSAGIAFDLGDSDRALAELSLLAQLAPHDYAPGHLAGTIYTEFSQHALAIRSLRDSLKLNPPDPARYAIGCLLAENEIHELDFDAALETLDGLRAGPEQAVLRIECLWKLGRKDEAQEGLDSLLQGQFRSTRLNWLAAQILWSEKRSPRAIALLRVLLKAEPWHIEGRYLLTQILESRGMSEAASQERARYQEAVALQERLSELNRSAATEPDNAAVCDELAELCEQLGRPRLSAMWSAAGQQRRAAKQPHGTESPAAE